MTSKQFWAVEYFWKRGKLVAGDYAIPMAGRDACERCAPTFATTKVAFVAFFEGDVEFLRVAGTQAKPN
jgi:hypothetical protein